MSTQPRRRRMEVEDIGDVTVVHLLDRKILDEQNIQMIGEQLFQLVDELGKRKVLLDMSAVEYLSSAANGKLITLHKKLQAVNGKLILSGIREDIYEVFEITKLRHFFGRIESFPDVQALFNSQVFLCPVNGCGGEIHSAHPSAQTVLKDSITCLECGAISHLDIKQIPRVGEADVPVLMVSLPTYEKERISISSLNCFTVGIQGRLDLFASEILEKACATVPAPRWVVFDVRGVNEFSRPGIETVLGLCNNEESNGKAVILLNEKQQHQVDAFPAGSPVYAKYKEAFEALGEIPNNARGPLKTRVRQAS